MATAQTISSVEGFEQHLQGGGGVVALFHAKWHEPCKQMLALIDELAGDFPTLSCITIDADEVPDLATRFSVSAAPTTFTFAHGAVVDTIEGADVAKVVQAAKNLSSTTTTTANVDLEALVNREPIMVFMKGSPSSPKCGFSSKLVELLNSKKRCSFGFVDILEDDIVRKAMKDFANWKTYPQLWINGKFVGGLDIVSEMDESGELDMLLDEVAPRSTLDDRLRALISSSPIMLFMKGTPASPKCGFSRQIVAILARHQVKFSSFDILSDDEVRQGLKKLSQWPTYPQLYVNGELLGGLDIVAELDDADELTEALSPPEGS